jgi:hypothetical protein
MEIIDKGYDKALNDALIRQKKRINKEWLILFLFTCFLFAGLFINKHNEVIIKPIKYIDSCTCSDSIECLNNQIIYYKKFYNPKK